jgi:hypothetical protein
MFVRGDYGALGRLQLHSEGRTVTVKGGGVNVKFPEAGSVVPLRYSQRGSDQLLLHIQAWDADIGLRDDLIGQVGMPHTHSLFLAPSCPGFGMPHSHLFPTFPDENSR